MKTDDTVNLVLDITVVVVVAVNLDQSHFRTDSRGGFGKCSWWLLFHSFLVFRGELQGMCNQGSEGLEETGMEIKKTEFLMVTNVFKEEQKPCHYVTILSGQCWQI
ncbi:nudix hydrolase 1-like [Senna tora]|uniref:Nudix hydrolase 1-like n=1 Tax=Senna tora TaxID=362788 RepID=A0A834T0W8_9FABA|nr:nudix hydrolase 1-like [Senna tora]